MHKITLQWKSFNVCLDNVSNYVANICEDIYKGCSADTELTLWFSEAPNQEDTDVILEYWDNITEVSSEAENYISSSAIADAIAAQKTAMLSLSWDAMSVAQRKIMLGQTPTRVELGL